MRLRQLFEAPIEHLMFDPNHDYDTGRYINKTDIGPIKNDKGIVKIFSAFEKTPFIFNFFIKPQRIGDEYPRDIDGLEKQFGVKINPESISVFYTNNVTGKSYFPFNSWTLAHRMCHAIQASTREMNINYSFRIKKALSDMLNPIFEDKKLDIIADKSIEHSISGLSVNSYDDEDRYKIVCDIFTMKSARDYNITNNLDYEGELIAQYLISGRVKFNLSDKNNLDQKFDTHIKKSEHNINEIITDIFNDLKGKVLKF